jgi:carbon monoxide dehydrogenase subunit G
VRIQESIDIKLPSEDVYNFVANVNNLMQCSDVITEVRDAPQHAVKVGDTYSTTAEVMGRTIKTSHTVLTADPPNRLEMDGKNGTLNLKVEIVIESVEGGTRVTQVGEGKLSGAMRFARPIVERTVRKQVRSDLENMKRILEQKEA